MTTKLCQGQQIFFGNNMKYSDFTAGKTFLRNKRLSAPRPYCPKKMASTNKILLKFFLKVQVSAFIEKVNMPDKFQRNRWSRSP